MDLIASPAREIMLYLDVAVRPLFFRRIPLVRFTGG
jgi:hypothetical protein